jgi:ribulose 1,5-bisphosphate synthetase/thiazole synthase
LPLYLGRNRYACSEVDRASTQPAVRQLRAILEATMDQYDFIVLGGGNAGLTASKRVKAAGKKVALIDPTPIGGLCALRGCNPKKVLVRAAFWGLTFSARALTTTSTSSR